MFRFHADLSLHLVSYCRRIFHFFKELLRGLTATNIRSFLFTARVCRPANWLSPHHPPLNVPAALSASGSSSASGIGSSIGSLFG